MIPKIFPETCRLSGGVDFVPHLIHDDSGVGTQVAADINGDGLLDVISGNKREHTFTCRSEGK